MLKTPSYNPDQPRTTSTDLASEDCQTVNYPGKDSADTLYIPATMARNEEPGVGETLLGCVALLLLATLVCLLLYYVTL